MPDPFSWEILEPTAYEAIHQRRRADHAKILAFMPAKGGAGCSTVALNTAGALANHLGKKVILIDSDRRSGIISILLNLAKRNGLLEALRRAGDLTRVEWEQHVVRAAGIDLLLADPGTQAHLPSWADYYQLLIFLEKQYDYIVVDLPEVINPATAEVVRSAGSVFVVCTTEIPSIKLAQQRFRELSECGISSANLHLLVNRFSGGGPTAEGIARLVGRPEFATIPNDYAHVQEAVMASKLVAADSNFSKGCLGLARKALGLQPIEGKPLFSFLRNFARVA
jgi:pilus assembly protein CpaE